MLLRTRCGNRIYFVAFLAIGFVFYGIQSAAFRSTIAFWKGTVAPAMLSLLAGQLGGGGSLDGTGDGAKFSGPFGVAVDSLGNKPGPMPGNLEDRSF